MDKVLLGTERRLILNEEESKISAYHEAGHTLAAKLLPHVDPVRKVSMIPRPKFLGITLLLPEKERHLFTKEIFLSRISVWLAGRVAEEIEFGQDKISTAAVGDLESANLWAKEMVCRYGMSPLGLIYYHPEALVGPQQQIFLSESLKQKIEKEVQEIIDNCYFKAKHLILKNKEKLDRLAKALLEKKELDGEEVDRILK